MDRIGDNTMTKRISNETENEARIRQERVQLDEILRLSNVTIPELELLLRGNRKHNGNGDGNGSNHETLPETALVIIG